MDSKSLKSMDKCVLNQSDINSVKSKDLELMNILHKKGASADLINCDEDDEPRIVSYVNLADNLDKDDDKSSDDEKEYFLDYLFNDSSYEDDEYEYKSNYESWLKKVECGNLSNNFYRYDDKSGIRSYVIGSTHYYTDDQYEYRFDYESWVKKGSCVNSVDNHKNEDDGKPSDDEKKYFYYQTMKKNRM